MFLAVERGGGQPPISGVEKHAYEIRISSGPEEAATEDYISFPPTSPRPRPRLRPG